VADEIPLLFQKRGAIALLTLNRPDRLNAVSLGMYQAMERAFDTIDRDRGLRAVVLTGEGRAFCVGADLKAHGERGMTDAERSDYVRAGQLASRRIQDCPRPVVAAVNGHAIGAGLEMALASDLVVAAEDAKLRFPEISLGTFIGGGAVYTLARRVGLAKAKELIMVGDFFSGADAVSLGIANRSVPAGLVLATAMELADNLAGKAPVSLGHAKRLLNRVLHLDPETAMQLEADALVACMRTQDWKEGVLAFAEKRPARFVGE